MEIENRLRIYYTKNGTSSYAAVAVGAQYSRDSCQTSAFRYTPNENLWIFSIREFSNIGTIKNNNRQTVINLIIITHLLSNIDV